MLTEFGLSQYPSEIKDNNFDEIGRQRFEEWAKNTTANEAIQSKELHQEMADRSKIVGLAGLVTVTLLSVFGRPDDFPDLAQTKDLVFLAGEFAGASLIMLGSYKFNQFSSAKTILQARLKLLRRMENQNKTRPLSSNL